MDEFLYLWAQWGVLNFDLYNQLKEQFGDLQTAWHKVQLADLERVFGVKKAQRIYAIRQKLDFQHMTRQMEDLSIRLLFIEDTDYPEPLKSLREPPVFLFVRGQLPALHKAIGVVGTRKISDYGRCATEMLVSDLVRFGFVIVSGLALGVDACAHKNTLKEGGLTLGVLACGLDQIYPAANQHLGQQIIQRGGCLVSEFPLGTPPLRHHFPRRNRIIAGLSRGILVTEANIPSGALITADQALEEGRYVFAVPSEFSRKNSGTNHLIRKYAAKLVQTGDDILEEFKFESKESAVLVSFSESEKKILEFIASNPVSTDILSENIHITLPKLSEILIELQFKGVIREVGQKWQIV